jgi:long-chain fatty acid transport protein
MNNTRTLVLRRLALLRLLPPLCLLPLTAGVAHAAGYYATDIGVRAFGRAGAFVARADDGTAAWYNPAGFADQDGTRLHLDAGFVRQSIFFQRTDELGNATGFNPQGNSAAPRLIPFLGISSNFGLKNFTFALSGYGPNGRKLDYPAAGPGRYSLIDTNVAEAFAQLSVAWRPHPTLAIGAAFRYVYNTASQTRKISISGTPGNEDVNDVGLIFDVTDPFVPNAQFGILWSPTKWLDVGVAYRLPTTVEAKGELRVDPADVARLRATQFPNVALCSERTCAPSKQNRGDITVNFGMPSIFRAGVRVHQSAPEKRRWDLEVDFVWERWTGFGRLETIPTEVYYTLASPTPIKLPPIVEERGYGNAYSVRLGGDFEVLPKWLVARAGVFFETSAVPLQAVNVGIVDAPKIGFSAGLTFSWQWLTLSAAYGHTQLFEQEVRNSVTRQINLTYLALDAQSQSPVVGNGIYRSGWHIFTVGLGVNFDQLHGWFKGKK